MSTNKRRRLDYTEYSVQSDIDDTLRTLEFRIQEYINKIDETIDYDYKIGLGYIPYNDDSDVEIIKLLDKCLYVRQSIKDLITNLKQKISSLGDINLENMFNIKINNLYSIVMDKDYTLRNLLGRLNPQLHLMKYKEFLEDPNLYAFTYTPLQPYQPPPPNTNQNNTNRNTGSGIRRNRRSRRGGDLASSVLPILTSFALF